MYKNDKNNLNIISILIQLILYLEHGDEILVLGLYSYVFLLNAKNEERVARNSGKFQNGLIFVITPDQTNRISR